MFIFVLFTFEGESLVDSGTAPCINGCVPTLSEIKSKKLCECEIIFVVLPQS